MCQKILKNCCIGLVEFIHKAGADPGYVKRRGRDPKGGGAGWLIQPENSPKIT